MLRRLLVLISLLPSVVLGQQLTDSQLATQLLTLIPNNTSNAITPSNVRKVTQDGYDARVSVYGNLGLKGLLGYNTLFTLTNDKQLVHKKYVDDKFAAIASSVLSFNGRIGTVLPQAGDYTFDQIGSKPTSITGFGIIPTFADYASFYYPLTGNPSNFATLAQARAGFSAPGTFFNYNSLTGVLGTTYTPLSNSLAQGKVFIGNSSGIATEQTPSGDITVNQSGVFTLPNVNSSIGTFNNININAKGQAVGGLNISYELLANKNVTGTMGNSNVQFPTEFTLRNYINSLGFYDGSSPITTETDPVFATNGVNIGGGYSNPSWINSLAWGKITGAPSFLTSYTETDPLAVKLAGSYSNPVWINSLPWSKITSAPAFLTSYTETDPLAVKLAGSYSNPSWVTSLPWSKITGAPTFLTSYTETDPLAVKLAGSYTNPSWLVSIPYSKVTGAPAGIDSYTKTEIQQFLSGVIPISGYNKTNWDNAVLNTGSYANPTWISSLPYSKITGTPNLGLYELLSNKSTTLSSPDNTKYPTTLTVSTALSTKEDVSNKAVDMSVINNIKYPTTQLLSTQLATKQNLIGYTPENVSNKSTSFSSPNNTTYPTTLATSILVATKQDQISLPASTIMGNYSGSTASYSPISIGSGLLLSAGTLSATPLSTTPLVVNTPLIIGSGTGTCVLVDSDGNTLVDTDGTPLVGPCGSGLSIQKADSTKDGYISKEDWLYFYHKANAGSGGGISTETDPYYTSYGAQKATTITINGVTQDLSANRTWTVAGGLTSFNSRTGAITPLVGDYSGFYYPLSSNPSNYLTTTTGDARYPQLTGSYANPAFVASLPSSKITGLGAGANWNTYTDIPGRPSAPPAQIQSDYTQTNTAALDYIKNKPVYQQTALSGPLYSVVANSGPMVNDNGNVIVNDNGTVLTNSGSNSIGIYAASSTQDGYTPKEKYIFWDAKEEVLTFNAPLLRSGNSITFDPNALAAGATGDIQYKSSTGGFAGSSDIHYDESTGFLGLGTATPTHKFEARRNFTGVNFMGYFGGNSGIGTFGAGGGYNTIIEIKNEHSTNNKAQFLIGGGGPGVLNRSISYTNDIGATGSVNMAVYNNKTGRPIIYSDSLDRVAVGQFTKPAWETNANMPSQFSVQPYDSSGIGLIVRGHSGQTGDLVRYQNNAGGDYFRVTSAGVPVFSKYASGSPKFLKIDGAGNLDTTSAGGSSTVPGSNGQLIFNSSGSLGATSDLSYTKPASNITRLFVNSVSNSGIGLQEGGVNKWSMASYSGGNFTFFNDATVSEAMSISPSNVVKIPNLGGSGTQMVVTDNSGNLSKQAIPSGGGGGGLTGFTTVGSTPNGNGGSVSGSSIILQPVDPSNPGVMKAVDYIRLYKASYTLQKFGFVSPLNTGTLTNLYSYNLIGNTLSNSGVSDGLSGDFDFAVIKNGGDPFPPAVALMFGSDTLMKLNAADFPTGTSFTNVHYYSTGAYPAGQTFTVVATIHSGNGFSGGTSAVKHYNNVAYSTTYTTTQALTIKAKGSYVVGYSGRLIFEPGN